eukprot:3557566-Rhodomonas_salina.2
MSGTDLAYGAPCYKMPGIDLGYAPSALRLCYGMSGTDLAYCATRSRYARRSMPTARRPL